jgi:TonB-linked SusC/RagA family outer membrane protein
MGTISRRRAGSRSRTLAVAITAGVLCTGIPRATVAQQQRATISGRVTDQGTGAPLADSRVFLVGTSTATTTNSEGRYTLRNLPTGTIQVRVLRVGYQEQKKPVTVTAGQEMTMDFQLTPAIVQLQEIVTTATGEQRRVEIGNAITTLGDVSKSVETQPITNLADLMTAKAPGVTVLPGAMVGATPVVKIRGLNSLSLSNDPIYVIDGVRMNAGNHSNGFTGTRTSYLNDLSPEEIEDIEIVKGPSAATLYGTDAANGVIVITTKKGRAGATRWTWYGEYGTVDDRNKYPGTSAIWGHAPGKTTPTRCVLVTIGEGKCIADSTTSVNILRDPGTTPLTLGHRDEYGGQVTGGSDAVRYFVSAGLQNEIGPFKMPDFAQATLDSMGSSVRDEWLYPEAYQQQNLRANISASPSSKFDLSANAGWSNTNQRIPQIDNNIYSVYYSAYQNPGFNHDGLGYSEFGKLGEFRNGYGTYSPAQIFQYVPEEGVQRFIGTSDAMWRPFSWMQNQGTVGLDFANRDNLRLCRYGECPPSGTLRLGTVRDQLTNDRNFSAKLVSTSSWQPMMALNLKTTFGGDYNNLESNYVLASGSQLPPGGQNADQAAVQSASMQMQTVNKTLGVYAQEQASIRDRLFLTAAVRTDQNSAFGTKFQRVYYPKLSASWIASDERFFPKYDWLNQFRLRAAYGASGVQPGLTQALQTFDASVVNIADTPGGAAMTDTPGLLANDLGNPELKPETSTEFEGGFESRLWNNRVNLDFTFYHKKTKDALINQPLAASSGASSLTVTRNLGSVENHGIEASITTTLIDRRQFGWDMTVGGSHNTNKILSLGVDANGNPNPTIFTGTNRDSLGLPILGVFARPFTYADADGNGIITPDEVTVGDEYEYLGYSQPRDLLTVQNGFDFFNRRLRIQSLFDYKGGFILSNGSVRFYCQQTSTCYDETHQGASLFDQARLVATRYKNPSTTIGYLENGQFWRFRELSATLTMPERFVAPIHARDLSLTFSARNLHVWTAYTGTDPESNYSTGDVQNDFSTTSPRTYFILRANLHY